MKLRKALGLPRWSWLLAAALPLQGCSAKKAPPQGELMLALQTDMSIPDDVSHVRIIVFKNGALKFDQKYRVGPGGDQIPATLGVVASDNPADTTEVRVLAYQGAVVRVLNRSVTTIPQERIATLRVPIEWLCDGQVKPSDGIPDSFDSSCQNPDEACVAGKCVKVQVDAATLPDFRRADITGGAEEPERGLCFDTAPCLDEGQDVTPDDDCVIEVPTESLDHLNVGLRLPSGKGGICSEKTDDCYIPLDQSETRGFHVLGSAGKQSRVQLPEVVCDKLSAGSVAAVRASAVCAPKLESIPTCGPWTSIGTKNPDKGPDPKLDPTPFPTDGGAPPGTDGPPGDAGAGGSGNANGTDGGTTAGGRTGGAAGSASVAGNSSGDGGTAGNAGSGGGDPIGECPGLTAPSPAPIASDPNIDRFARLLLETEQRVNAVRSNLGEACASFMQRLGKTRPTFSMVPTDRELEEACSGVQHALENTSGNWTTLIGRGACRAGVGEQLDLEQACNAGGCSFGTLPDRCVPKLLQCSGTCAGDCVPGMTMLNVECQGSCEGQCVGSCDGNCFGPGGNELPSSDCNGACDGHCSGTCQGSCQNTATCNGLCRGSCEGTVTGQFCELALDVPACATDVPCANLAAATAALHRDCGSSSAFVQGQTEAEFAPAIAGSLPQFLFADDSTFGLEHVLPLLSHAASNMETENADQADASCLMLAKAKFAPLSQSLGTVRGHLTNLLPRLSSHSGSSGGVCTISGTDDACTQCVKTNCCTEQLECDASSTCVDERQCLIDCGREGNSQGACAEICGTQGRLAPETAALVACKDSCSGCSGGSSAACNVLSGNNLIDDFDDGDSFSTFGPWTTTGGVGSTLTTITPGSNDSRHALGAAATEDPGLGVAFDACWDVSQSSSVAFDASAIDAETDVPLTLRVHTRATEPEALGGYCNVSGRCGDYHTVTVSVSPGGFSPIRVSWSNFINSGDSPPDLKEFLGIDFISFGGRTPQIAIDNLRFEDLIQVR